MLDAGTRKAAEDAAAELLRDTIGTDYSDTTLRVTTDHLLSFHRAQSRITNAKAEQAVDRLFEIASSDTGQSARVARFLMAWWNGTDLGDFPIADLFRARHRDRGRHLDRRHLAWPSLGAPSMSMCSTAGATWSR